MLPEVAGGYLTETVYQLHVHTLFAVSVTVSLKFGMLLSEDIHAVA